MPSSETDSGDSDYEECEIKLNSVFTKLNENVREQYLKFLKKQLAENIRTWQECNNNDSTNEENSSHETSIHECAKKMEDLALKEATITQLYQREMIKTIGIVKEKTKNKTLMEQLADFLKSNEKTYHLTSQSTQTAFNLTYETKAVQTEDIENKVENEPALTLDQRIDLFQSQLKKGQIIGAIGLEKPRSKSHVVNIDENRSSKKRRRHHQRRDQEEHHLITPLLAKSPEPNIWHSPTPPPHVSPALLPTGDDYHEMQLEGDEIAQELEKIFMEQETDLDEIFGLVPHRTTTITASKNCDKSMEVNSHVTPSSSATQINSNKTPLNQENKKPTEMMRETKVSKPTPPTNSNEQKFPKPIQDLRYSLWPCENFMQKRRLSSTLNRLVEEDIRWHDILKWQFSVLFGDDDNDDGFAPCSPSIELDEVLRSSCMKRISPWVVRNLMKPLNDGLIGNRFLFKKLAKRLAYHIIMENQYPDESVIKNAIENFFCIHHAVMSNEDLDDIQMLSITEVDM